MIGMIMIVVQLTSPRCPSALVPISTGITPRITTAKASFFLSKQINASTVYKATNDTAKAH